MADQRSCPSPAQLSGGQLQRDRVRAEQLRILIKACPAGVIAAATGAILLAFGLSQAGLASPTYAFAWGAALVGCVVAHCTICVAYSRQDPDQLQWRPWMAAFIFVASAEGMVWLVGAFWMTSSHDLSQELLVLLVSSAIASGAVVVFGTYFPVYAVFFYPTIAPHLWFSIAYDYPLHRTFVALLIAYLVAMTLIARRVERQFGEALELRFANADLVADLRIQTEVALRANADKSRFLAAASHDLRQPIHALGLLLGALREQTRGVVARRLIDHMDVSVAAMDDLFSALLDISKLDAGVMEARAAAVPVGPLLARLRRDHFDEAAAKGLILRARPTDAVVWSDPALLERVLRNLVVNAIRYTERGSILISCRSEGAGLRLEVWDTGIGIATDDQALIFEEFRQIGNPERDRAKGLGLGLAIVRRTLPLIGATLSLSSVPGRGSVFRLHLPRAPALASIIDPSGVTPAPRAGAIVLVIDDESDIRRAMAALLTGWGMANVVAGSADEMIALLPTLAEPPGLILSDYRLRDDRNGIDAIAEVRAACGRAVPAILVTGDTAPDLLETIRASGLTVLHKPVAHGRLRAAIGNLMRVHVVAVSGAERPAPPAACR